MFDPVYLLIGLFIVTINAIPGFMPPTWMILAFFYLHFNLSLIPLVLVGATSATFGRIILSQFARLYIRRIFPHSWLKNYEDLGNYFKIHQKLTIPLVFMYAFLPIPSNQVFIIAGLADLNVKLIALSFLLGRLISYTFWVTLADKVIDNLEIIFTHHFTNINTLILEAVSFSLIFIIGKINWRKILKF